MENGKYNKTKLKTVETFINESLTEAGQEIPSKLSMHDNQAEFTKMFQSKLSKMVDTLNLLNDNSQSYYDETARNIISSNVENIISCIEVLNRHLDIETIDE